MKPPGQKRKSTTIPLAHRGPHYVSPKKKTVEDTGPSHDLSKDANLGFCSEPANAGGGGNVVGPVTINDTYLCQMRNGHWMKAQVLAARKNLGTSAVEYFVHFEGVDRRLDQWLTISQIDTSTEKGSRDQNQTTTTNANNPNPTHPPTTNKIDLTQTDSKATSEHHHSDSETSHSNSETSKCEEKRRVTRNMKRMHDNVNHVTISIDDMDPITASLEKEHCQKTRVKFIDTLIYSNPTTTWEINTWYFSPYPNREIFNQQFAVSGSNGSAGLRTSYFNDSSAFYKFPKIYVSAFTLRFFDNRDDLLEHLATSDQRQPPGRMIYIDDIRHRDFHQLTSSSSTERSANTALLNNNNTSNDNPSSITRIAVYEIDGMQHKRYCQHLCLLSKLFLDHKTLYFDTEPFMFYVLCELDENGATMVGYYSKQKDSVDKNNLACIIVLPPFQRQGYGKFIIDLSYKISRISNNIGSPERPLSDLGNVSYKSYWDYTLLRKLKDMGRYGAQHGPSIEDLVKSTGIYQDDVIESLRRLNLTKLWRGEYKLDDRIDKSTVEHILSSYPESKLLVKSEALKWRPGRLVDKS